MNFSADLRAGQQIFFKNVLEIFFSLTSILSYIYIYLNGKTLWVADKTYENISRQNQIFKLSFSSQEM